MKRSGGRNRSIVIDASNLILGRLASNVAKRILNGEQVIIVNAEKAVISGSKKNIVAKFETRLGLRTLGSQKKAPKRPRKPNNFIRRVVRGMLPWDKSRGKMAYRRLKVYIGVPQEIKVSLQTLPKAKKDEKMNKFITVGELLKTFSWNNKVNLYANDI